ncbi:MULTISPECIES: hypothetical protein [unclassified Aureispira]|uniref:hypothetical protein n=1 Tax=unclassified Aureispira TaxID=2649989 RepID=UPI00069753A2|nr:MULTISPECIES: hypothetical protein [unclassified Aureispira]WMX15640.1 hypothetical protein QP953_04505 [Aureispira sp. CCB-E]
MRHNEDDLLESYEDNDAEYDFFQESKENTNNVAYGLVMLGFLVVLGIKFVMSLTDTRPDVNAIIMRQVKLLKIAEQATTTEEAQAAMIEYDSLARVLDLMEEESL